MRSLSGAALVLAAVLAAAPVSAQTSLSFALGANVPVGSTADDLEVGWNAAMGLGIKPPLAPIGLRLEGLFSEMNSKIYNSGKDRVVAGIANVTISGAGMPMPMGYLIGGLGMYNVAGSDYPALTGRNASARCSRRSTPARRITPRWSPAPTTTPRARCGASPRARSRPTCASSRATG